MKREMLTPSRRKKKTEDLNEVKKSLFFSLNSSLGWLVTIFIPFCFAASSRYQQCLPNVHFRDQIKQKAVIQEMEKLDTTMTYDDQVQKKNNQSLF